MGFICQSVRYLAANGLPEPVSRLTLSSDSLSRKARMVLSSIVASRIDNDWPEDTGLSQALSLLHHIGYVLVVGR